MKATYKGLDTYFAIAELVDRMGEQRKIYNLHIKPHSTATTQRKTRERKRIALVNEYLSLHSLCSKLFYI